jgi:hypothetical protein
MFSDYARKQQYVFQVLSKHGALDFEETVTRFLTLGDDNLESKRSLRRLAKFAPKVIDVQRPPPSHLPGLRSEHFRNYPEGVGYYSWLVQLMFESERDHQVRFGRFENLRTEALRLLEETGTPITSAITEYLEQAEALNASSRPKTYVDSYGPELATLVVERDSYLIDRFGYQFSEPG